MRKNVEVGIPFQKKGGIHPFYKTDFSIPVHRLQSNIQPKINIS